MLLQITQIYFYDSDYVTLHSDMSIMTENGAKITQPVRSFPGTCSEGLLKVLKSGTSREPSGDT